MNNILIKLRNLFCYCGMTRDEYNAVKKEAYISNFTVWKYLHALMAFGFFLMGTLHFIFDARLNVVAIYAIAFLYSLFACFLFFSVFKKDSLGAQLTIYLSMAVIMLIFLLLKIRRNASASVGFIAMLVLLPMFMVDKPYYMIIFLSVSIAVYLSVEHSFTDPQAFIADSVNAIFFGSLGFVINVFYNRIRISGFILRQQEREVSASQAAANAEMLKLNKTLRTMSESMVDLLGDVVESRDLESGKHVRRVKGFTKILATQVMSDLPEYGLDAYAVDLITFMSPLHDIGKIAISDSILCKPGKLTPEEFDAMKTHCEKGHEIVLKMSDKWSKEYIDMAADICLCHHEKWDGKGYPRGLSGDNIPIAAQIVSIADIYDALTTERVYKKAYSYDKAFCMILEGECGAFSEKLISCLKKCRVKFEAYAEHPDEISFDGRNYELVSKSNPGDSFVIGMHDQDRTLREKARLSEEVSVLESLSDEFFYVCYVDMISNEVIRYKADERFKKILDSFGDSLQSNERFDKLLNSIIVSEDYENFRNATERYHALRVLQESKRLFTDFRIRLEDGVHHCRMKITKDTNNPYAVIIGIYKRDEEYRREKEYLSMQQQLERARAEIENREKLADRLAVIDSISNEYDYVCSLNAETMDVVVYRAVDWIRDMFKNLEDIVVSPETRDKTLQGIIHPEDFESFKAASMHTEVVRALSKFGEYTVNYRAYRYGELLNYQTRYTIDKNNPKRIIIGLRCISHENH